MSSRTAVMLVFLIAPAFGLVYGRSFIDGQPDTLPSESNRQTHAHQPGMEKRGHIAMGFDQALAAHHFRITKDGGAIEIDAKDASDVTTRGQIRMHLRHIATLFSEGKFDKPEYIHAQVPPGVDAMTRLRKEITYSFEETTAGGRVRISTKNPEARDGIHDFLRFQIAEHQTGDRLR